MRFVDSAVITVRSGSGGHGCVSFRRERYVPKGGPDGGDGGRGGDIILRASERLLTLYDLRLKRHYIAKNGHPGHGKLMYGRSGDDLILDVPIGTLVYELSPPGETEKVLAQIINEPVSTLKSKKSNLVNMALDVIQEDLPTSDACLIADLSALGQTLHICRGGRGGKGNEHFKSSTMRAPYFAQPGEPGEKKHLRLDLKLLADCGIIGLPNAGKSTLIATISAARPKISAYPFTTLTPNLGIMADELGWQLVIVDIPGLIEGAHMGLGLGHRFLKHVQRTRFLVHCLSVEELDTDDPMAGFDLVNQELLAYDPTLAKLPQLEVLTKIDLLVPTVLADLRSRLAMARRQIFLVSAVTGEGIKTLVAAMWIQLKALVQLSKAEKLIWRQR
ncbi:GTPase ObgE [Desulfovibrionales bacterium]